MGLLPTEKRNSFIGNGAKSEIASSDWTNIVGSKPMNSNEYLPLYYSRLVCGLWGVVKGLNARVAASEDHIDELEA